MAAGLALVIGAALAFQAAGLSMGLGAFVAGMMVADSEYRHQLETDIVPFKGLLLGLFFMAVGSATNLALLSEMPIMMTTLALTLVAIKAFSIYPLARWYGLDHAEALRGAVTLSQSGEFAFVLLTSATAASIISTEMFDTGILLVTLSMITTPLLLKGIESRLHKQSSAQQAVYDSIDEPANPVIIAGFGRVGQIVGRLLTMRHIPFTALEINPAQVDFVRQFGNKIYYGDATRMDLLRTAHIEQAQALVLVLDEEEASIRLAETIRETFPHVTIFARARNRHHEMVLRELGVEHVVRETLLSSLAMSRQLLQGLGDSHEKAAESVAHFQAHDNTTFARQMAVFRDDHAFKQTTRQATEELKQLFDADAVNLE